MVDQNLLQEVPFPVAGRSGHKRSSDDYLERALDTVSLEDWSDIVSTAVAAAKEGDHASRVWLANYLIGKAETKAPSSLEVMTRRWRGESALANEIAAPYLMQLKLPFHALDEKVNQEVQRRVSTEIDKRLTQKLTME